MSPLPAALELPDLFRALDLMGVFINGILGGVVARTHRLDLIGFISLAIASALGGGMMRDMLLQVGTPAAIAHPEYLVWAVLGAMVAFVVNPSNRVYRWAIVPIDGLVLGAWSATGAIKTLSSGFGWQPALLLGVTTAVGGSVVRDISVGQIPGVFAGNRLYATPALLAAVVAIGFWYAGEPNLGMLAATLVGCAFALLARWRGWQLPQGGEEWRITLTSSQLKRLISLRRNKPGDEDDLSDLQGEPPPG